MLAEDMKDTETRRIMNRLADGWDEMADRAERRVARPDRYATETDCRFESQPIIALKPSSVADPHAARRPLYRRFFADPRQHCR